MTVWERTRTELGARWWLTDERTGPMGTLPNGDPWRAPRMTVIDKTCNTSWRLSIFFLILASVAAVFITIGLATDEDAYKDPFPLFMAALMYGFWSCAFANFLTAMRLDNLMSVVGSPIVKSIYFDWHVEADVAQSPPESAPKSNNEKSTRTEDAGGADTAPDYEILLPGDKAA